MAHAWELPDEDGALLKDGQGNPVGSVVTDQEDAGFYIAKIFKAGPPYELRKDRRTNDPFEAMRWIEESLGLRAAAGGGGA